MDPNQQPDYSFIMDPNQSNQPSGPVFGGGNKTKQYIIFAVFLLVVIMVVVIVASLIFSSGKESAKPFLTVQAYQTEINRVIELSSKDTADPSMRNQLATLKSSLTTDNLKLGSAMNSSGINTNSKNAISLLDSKTDEALENAKSQGRHDEVLDSIINDLSSEYYSSLNSAIQQSSSTTIQSTLDIAQTNIETIFQDSEQ